MSEVTVTTVKHINQKTAGVDPKEAIKTEKPVFMLRITGVIQGVKNFEDRRSGDVKTVFLGEFAGVGPKGQIYTSDKMFTFRGLEEKFASAFKAGEEKAVEFSYDIHALPDAKSATGYVYAAKSVIPTATTDRLGALLKIAGEHALPVDAVNTEEKPEATAKTAKAKG